MPVLQKTIRDRRLKSIELTYSQRSQQREMLDYFITSVCRTGAGKGASVLAKIVTIIAIYKIFCHGLDSTGWHFYEVGVCRRHKTPV
jgi:hypothetical protein